MPSSASSAQAIVDGDVFADLRLAFFAVGDRPVLASAASKLIRVAVTPEVFSDASTALGEELDPAEDQQATAAMRRHLAKVLLTRSVSALLGARISSPGGLRDGAMQISLTSTVSASMRWFCRGSIWRTSCVSICS